MGQFEDRTGWRASIVLVNAADLCEVPGVVVEVRSFVRPGDFWLGRI